MSATELHALAECWRSIADAAWTAHRTMQQLCASPSELADALRVANSAEQVAHRLSTHAESVGVS